MSSDNIVTLKGVKDGILVIFDENSDFETCKKSLSEKIQEAKHFFTGSKAAVSFQGRMLNWEEEKQIIDIFSKQANMNVSFIFDHERYQAQNIAKNIKEKFSEHDSITKVHQGSIRSGQLLEYPGTVIILGDINPGGYVNAKDNIIVLGSIKGQVHAGIEGNINAFVAALSMLPTQLRIAHIITRFPEDYLKNENKTPVYAMIQNNNIAIIPLQ